MGESGRELAVVGELKPTQATSCISPCKHHLLNYLSFASGLKYHLYYILISMSIKIFKKKSLFC